MHSATFYGERRTSSLYKPLKQSENSYTVSWETGFIPAGVNVCSCL